MPADALAANFGHSRCHPQGLVDAPVERHNAMAWPLLTERYRRAAADLSPLGAIVLIELRQQHAKRLQLPAAKCVVNELRSCLRYGKSVATAHLNSLPHC